MAYGERMVRDLLKNDYTGDYTRRGEWDFDGRKLDPNLDPEEVVSRYR